MKYILRFLASTSIIALFGFLYLFFGHLQVLADSATEEAKLIQMRSLLHAKFIENACRDNGLILDCFETDRASCIKIQTEALPSCLESNNVKGAKEGVTTTREQFVEGAWKTSSCAFQSFYNERGHTLKTERAECREPDANKLFEMDKILAELKEEVSKL